MLNEPTYSEAPPVPIGVAARTIGVSVGTLRRWEAEGKIKSIRTAGGQRRYEASEVERAKAGVR